MAGPTPVSALIHAATMVTAGVYLMCPHQPGPRRVRRLGADADRRGSACVTALVRRDHRDRRRYDIKQVLAYSTISQLGYMFLAVGVGRLLWPRSST